MPPLLLQLEVKNAFFYSKMGSGKTELEIHLDCQPLLTSGTFVIGDKYVFAASRNHMFFVKRDSSSLYMRFVMKNSLTKQQVEAIGLSESKIGFVSFMPSECENRSKSPIHVNLDATIFVDDSFLEKILSALQAGKVIEWINILIEKEGILTYGWEPDGSRKLWKLEASNVCTDVDVVSLGMNIKLASTNS